jgi:flagellar L-ring protein FlgH
MNVWTRMLITGVVAAALPWPGVAVSLWTADCASLLTDQRARAVGDLLTVIIVQQSSSSTTAKHATGKNLTVNAAAGSGWFSGFPGLGIKADRSTTGSGSSVASSSFSDTLTVKVVEVLPNGVLKIEGVRTIQMEKDRMELRFTGVVRSQDVAPDNTVPSVLVAEQRLDITGAGPISEKQKPGLISRLLSLLW